MRFMAAVLLGVGSIGNALAQDPDLGALAVADKAQAAAPPQAHDWRVLVEGALDVGSYAPQGGQTPGQEAGRISLDLYDDSVLLPRLQAVLADRLDVEGQKPLGTAVIDTLKEAYLSWQESPDRMLDLGRINVRNGVALGYNPTDYFRFDAVRSVVSINPDSLRENRLGSVMARAQQLWNGGSLTALVSPRLEDEPSAAPLSPDLGATNSRTRWLLAFSERLGVGFDPQLLVFGSEHQSVQAGLDLTHLIGSAVVAYAEWSGGRGATLEEQALGASGPTAFLSRLSTGLTCTTPINLSVTVEYERNEAAPDHSQWTALEQAAPAQLERVAGDIAVQQDLPDRQGLFVLALWTDSFVRHLDLSAFTRLDLGDDSHLSWLEARYHWSHLDLALQWQVASGSPDTIYGAASPRGLGQLLVDGYLP